MPVGLIFLMTFTYVFKYFWGPYKLHDNESSIQHVETLLPIFSLLPIILIEYNHSGSSRCNPGGASTAQMEKGHIIISIAPLLGWAHKSRNRTLLSLNL